MSAFMYPNRRERNAFKRSTSPLTTGTLWTFTGGIFINSIHGIVRTAIQAQATTVKVSVQNDALTLFDLCVATLDLNAAAIGSTIILPAAVASAAVLAAGGAGITLLPVPHLTLCTTSGIVKVTYGAASTGVIDWYMRWSPATPGATVT